MTTRKKRKTMLKLSLVLGLIIIFTIASSTALSAEGSAWDDTFYQYRIPVEIEVEKAGWNFVPLTQAKITAAINRSEEMQYDPLWFAYNNIKVVEVDEKGKAIGEKSSAGFYLVPVSDELVKNGSFENTSGDTISDWIDRTKEKVFTTPNASPNGSKCLSLKGSGAAGIISKTFPVEATAYYLLSYRSKVETIGGCPAVRLISARAYTRGLAEDSDKYPVSYIPFLWRKAWTKYEQLMKPYFYWNEGGAIRVAGSVQGTAFVDDISFRKVKLVFLANVKKPGTHRWMVYYQPLNAAHVTVPKLRHPEIPPSDARLIDVGSAQKYHGKTRYKLTSNDLFDAWFAETTVKLTPHTLVPEASSGAIKITSAKNEKQSFQIIIRPKISFEFERVGITDLYSSGSGTKHKIPAHEVKIYSLDYVPILRKTPTSPVSYSGLVADPMTAVQSQTLAFSEGNYPLWVTINVPGGTPAGSYTGSIVIKGEGKNLARLPLELEVYDFQLPEFSTFRTLWGSDYMTKVFPPGTKTIADYHALSSRPDIRKLTRQYYSFMARNKFYTCSVAMYSPIKMKWSPPPHGYNVDKPDNFFKLYDWDFTEFNKDLKHYIDDLKVNSFALTMTNPTVCNIFTHLPGAELEKYKIYPEGHFTLDWQAWHEITCVGYDKRDWDWIDYKDITIKQYDRLLLDFYRTMAENLEKHGWLDMAYIFVDETYDRGMPPWLHFLRLLKSDPLTSRLKVLWCIQGDRAFTYKENPHGKQFTFNSLIDVYVPQTNEVRNIWEKYYFTDYHVIPEREKLWNYTVTTSRAVIDVPGVTNRIAALDVFNKGGSGYLRWQAFAWDSGRVASDNPWDDPGTHWGNGMLSYFYPPGKYGPVSEPTWTVIPSLRIETYREGVDDYEYAKILEDLIAAGEKKGVDVSGGKTLIKEIERFFPGGSVHWSQNDAWYIDLRDRMANAIINLKKTLK